MKIDRAQAPEIFTPNCVEAMAERISTTNKGVKVYSLTFPQFDVIRISLVFRAGTKYQSMPFLANSTISMLSEGTKTKNSKEISDILDFYGLYFDVSIDRDYSVITICCLAKFFDEALAIFEDIILNPIFPQKELKVLKNKRKHTLKMEREKVDYIALENFSKAIYGIDHPYGSTYNENMYDDLTPKDLQTFFEKFYLRNNMFCVASGNMTPEQSSRISDFCDKFPEREFTIVNKSDINKLPETVKIKKKNSLQSAIKIGRRMFAKSHEDFVPMQLLSTVLGGYFGSRLIKNIREDKGYTYSIFAAMVNMEDSGHFVITTEVASEHTKNAVEEIFKEMERLKTDLIPQDELTMVRNVIIGQVLRILDGPFGIADVTIENIQNYTDNRSVGEMIRLISKIESKELQELAKKYFKKENMSIIIVGK